MTDVASILLGPKGRPSLAQPIGLGSGARPFSRSEGSRFTPVARNASGRVSAVLQTAGFDSCPSQPDGLG